MTVLNKYLNKCLLVYCIYNVIFSKYVQKLPHIYKKNNQFSVRGEYAKLQTFVSVNIADAEHEQPNNPNKQYSGKLIQNSS